MINVSLFGGFTLSVHGETIRLVSARLRAFFALISLTPAEPQPRSRVADLLWDASLPEQARTNLRKLLLEIRRLLPEAAVHLHLSGPFVGWSKPEEVLVDVAEFRRLTTAGSLPALRRAVELYRGELVPDLTDEWLVAERQRLHDEYLRVLRRTATLLESRGETREAVAHWEQLLRLDPFSEEAVQHLLRLHAREGDRGALVRTYQAFAAELKEQLHIKPSAETRELFEHLQATVDQRFQATQPPGGTNRRVLLSRFEEGVFVGRETELALFEAILGEERPEIVNVYGPGGVGKTFLLQAFGRLAHRAHRRILYLDGRDLAAGWESLSRALGSSTVADPVSFLNVGKTALLIDNVEEMGGFLSEFATRLVPALSTDVAVVLAGRVPLYRLLPWDSPCRRIVRYLPLSSFNTIEAAEYLRRRGVADEGLIQAVIWSSGGNPLALALAADLVVQFGLTSLANGAWQATVRSLVAYLLREVDDPELLELLAMAAVVRRLDAPLVSALSAWSPERCAAAFDRLARLSVVRPSEQGFTLHNDIRELLLEDLRWQNPERLVALRLAAIHHYIRRIEERPRDRWTLLPEVLFFCGNAFVRGLLFGEEEGGRLFVTEARPNDQEELYRLWYSWIREQIGWRGTALAAAEAHFREAITSPQFELCVVRNLDGDIRGFAGVFPLTRGIVPLLLASPNTRATLVHRYTEAELANLPEDVEQVTTYFLRYLVHSTADQDAVRAILLRHLFGYAARSAHYLTSVAATEVQRLVELLGFRSLPGAVFHAEGAPVPERGYELDLRTVGFVGWLEWLVRESLAPTAYALARRR